MRAYFFNVESGLYAGEAYCEPREVREEEGVTVNPPPERHRGTVPVYDRAAGAWMLVPVETIGGDGHA